MKFSIEVLKLAFNKTWDKLSNDEGLLKFFEDKGAFLDFFTMVNREDESGKMHRVDDGGYHKDVVFYGMYHRMAIHLHPDSTRKSITKEDCQLVFSTLENRPSHIEDLKQTVLKEEAKFVENMKTLQVQHQMLCYLNYHLYKGMIEILVNAKNEIKDDLLFSQIMKADLSIPQSCMVIFLMGSHVKNYTDTTVLCGFSKNSVKAFRDSHTSFLNDEKKIYDHGRETSKDLQRVLKFLNEFNYPTTIADQFYSLFKEGNKS